MEPIIVFKGSMKAQRFPAGDMVTKLVYPDTIGSAKLVAGLVEAAEGKSPHRWHTHTTDKTDEMEVIYAKDFEELYYVLKGNGKMQWKKADGTIHEEAVGEGDLIYMPPGVIEHQLLNIGEGKLIVFYAGTPPSRWVKRAT